MPKRAITAQDLLKIEYVGDPQIRPDGSEILFTKKVLGAKNKMVTNLFTVNLDGDVTQWTQGDSGASHGRWSPDGSRIAFISAREKPKAQIYVISRTGGEAAKLTNLPEGSIGGFKWSPDGTKLAFLFRETHPNWTDQASKEREESGLSTPPHEIDSEWYRLDGDGYFDNQRYKIYVADATTGEHKEVYAADSLGEYSFDWLPTSDKLVVAHSACKFPFREKSNDQLFVVSLDGKAAQIPGLPGGTKGGITVSPDGKLIAYVGSTHEHATWGTENQHLYVVNTDGSNLRCLTEKDDYSMGVMSLSDSKDASGDYVVEWAPDGQAIYVSIGWHGEVQLAYVPLATGSCQMLTKGKHSVTVGNVSKDGEFIACLWGDATRLTEVAVYEMAKHQPAPRVLTHFNEAFHEEIHAVEPEEMWLKSPDGNDVHAWVMKPFGFSEKNKYPAILQVHGGPHAQYGWAFFHEFQLLAAEGYMVFFSNPRGSKGYGEDFCQAIKGCWGDKDWQDIQTVTHAMEHHPNVNAGRMGVMGGSYGGYMTNWVIGHTKVFRAAITDRCVSNLVSMGGSSDFPMNKDDYFGGCVWGDLESIRALWKQSPIAYFEGVETPTLVIHSEGDLRCNIEQGEQVFHALQMQGVPSRFVRYPRSTFHGMSRTGPPDLRLHRLAEIVGWMDRWLKA